MTITKVALKKKKHQEKEMLGCSCMTHLTRCLIDKDAWILIHPDQMDSMTPCASRLTPAQQFG